MAAQLDVKALRERVRKAAMRGVVRGTESVRNEAIQLIMSGAKSGKIYWRRGTAHQASAPGEAPASDTGTLVKSITTRYDLGSLSGRVVAQAKYAPYLEYGTATMAPRPFLRPALANKRQEIEDDIQKAITEALSGGP